MRFSNLHPKAASPAYGQLIVAEAKIISENGKDPFAGALGSDGAMAETGPTSDPIVAQLNAKG